MRGKKMEAEKKILYPADIVKETGLGMSKIYELLKTGEIPHVKAGDRYLVSRANFEKWLNGEGQAVKTC
jgi:excisionase family DNA binding protein